MSENHYKVLLETYRKQEIPLNDKHQQLEEVLKKYQSTMLNLKNSRDQRENESFKLAHKRLTATENMLRILNACEESALSWQGIKEKHTRIDGSQKQSNNLLGRQLNSIRGVEQELKHLENELKMQNISSKINEYKEKTETSEELLEKCARDFLKLSGLNLKLPDYQISETWGKCEGSFPKKIGEINAEIIRVNRNLKLVNQKIREMENSMRSEYNIMI